MVEMCLVYKTGRELEIFKVSKRVSVIFIVVGVHKEDCSVASVTGSPLCLYG